MIYKPNRPSIPGYVATIGTASKLDLLEMRIELQPTEVFEVCVSADDKSAVDLITESFYYTNVLELPPGTWQSYESSLDYEVGFRHGYNRAKAEEYFGKRTNAVPL